MAGLTNSRRWTGSALGTTAALALLLLAPTGAAAAPPTDAQAVPDEQSASSLIVYADMVQGSTNVPDELKESRSCVLSNRFARNSQIVWRARVIDPRTGLPMDDTAVAKLQVNIPGMDPRDMRYAKHGPDDTYWTVSWIVPADFPTGSLDVSLSATGADGRSGKWTPFKVAPSLLTITDEVWAG